MAGSPRSRSSSTRTSSGASAPAAPCPCDRPAPRPGGSPGPGEVQRLAGTLQPVLARIRVEAEPLPHRRALVRVETDAIARLDELVDPLRRKLHHQPATNQHHEDPALKAEGAAAETAAAPRRRYARGADKLVDQVLVPLVRPAVTGVLPGHDPSLGVGPDNRTFSRRRYRGRELLLGRGELPARSVLRAGMRCRRPAGRLPRPLRP